MSVTEGAVDRMFRQGGDDKSYQPVLQVINVKAVGGGGSPRYRVVLSDGRHFVQGMLATQLVDLVTSAALQVHSLVRVDEFMKNEVQNKTILILLRAEVVGPNPGARIGNPVDVQSGGVGGGGAPAAAQAAAQPLYQPHHNENNSSHNNNAAAASAYGGGGSKPNTGGTPNNPYGSGGGSNPYGGGSGGGGGSSSQQQNRGGAQAPIARAVGPDGQPITLIQNLNMYNNRWTIKARVTSKTDIRTWSNAKGEGSLFSVELLDASGTDIRATFFKEAVDQFYNMLQVGKVFRLSGGKLKVANMQYNTCKSNFEITFDQNSEISLDNDSGDIARQQYEFCKIAALEGKAANSNVDVVAVVKHVNDPATLTSKKSGQELTKCDLTLVDDSGVEINLTLWGDKATRAPAELAGNPVVAFRRARVSDYGGKSLSGGDGIEVSPPDVPEVQALQAWWQSTGSAATTATRSLSSSGGGGRQDTFAERKTVAAIKEEGMGQSGSDKADWLSFKAAISFIKKDREGGAWYPACPNAGEPCKNRYKVTQTTDQQYYCEKCMGTFDHCVRRWIFSGCVEDDTASTWVSFFNEQAEQLLGETADVVYAKAYGADFDQDAYESVFAKHAWSEWIFKCKVKSELVNDESRIKASVYSMHPVDYLKEANDILGELAKF